MTYTVEPLTDGGPGTGRHHGPDALWTRLGAVEARVREAVAARRALDPDPDDPYRGQYLTPEAAERILDEPGGLDLPGTWREPGPGTGWESGSGPESEPGSGREPEPGPGPKAEPEREPWRPPAGSLLDGLVRRFGLTPLDLDLLLVAVAPDLDARFERLYGYLNDDLTRRRPRSGSPWSCAASAAPRPPGSGSPPGAPLVDHGLVEVTEPERPPLSRVLAVPDRITAHLLGDDRPDARLAGVLDEVREDPTADRRTSAAPPRRPRPASGSSTCAAGAATPRAWPRPPSRRPGSARWPRTRRHSPGARPTCPRSPGCSPARPG